MGRRQGVPGGEGTDGARGWGVRAGVGALVDEYDLGESEGECEGEFKGEGENRCGSERKGEGRGRREGHLACAEAGRRKLTPLPPPPPPLPPLLPPTPTRPAEPCD